MSDAPKAAAPPAAPMKRTEYIFPVWAHVIPEGVDWHAALTREYWTKNTDRFRDGSSVLIHSSDHRIQFEMLILHVNAATDPITLELVFRPIHPADLVLPAPDRQRPARYETREVSGSGGLFHVIDKSTGEALRDNPMARSSAAELCASLQRAADQMEREMLVDEFARSQRTAAAPVGDTQLAMSMREALSAPPRKRTRGRPRKAAAGGLADAQPLAAQGTDQ